MDTGGSISRNLPESVSFCLKYKYNAYTMEIQVQNTNTLVSNLLHRTISRKTIFHYLPHSASNTNTNTIQIPCIYKYKYNGHWWAPTGQSPTIGHNLPHSDANISEMPASILHSTSTSSIQYQAYFIYSILHSTSTQQLIQQHNSTSEIYNSSHTEIYLLKSTSNHQYFENKSVQKSLLRLQQMIPIIHHLFRLFNLPTNHMWKISFGLVS